MASLDHVCDTKMSGLPVTHYHDKSVAEQRYQTGSVSLLASGNGRVCSGVGTYHVAHDELWRASLIEV